MSLKSYICDDCGEPVSEEQHKALGVCESCEHFLRRCWQRIDRTIDRLEGRYE